MDELDKRSLIQHRLATAKDELETARILIDAGKYRKAISSAYYTIFHVASAALLWHDQERAKHSQCPPPPPKPKRVSPRRNAL